MKTRQPIRRVLMGIALLCCWTVPSQGAGRVVVVQTNSAGDNVHLIDPATNKIVGTIEGIESMGSAPTLSFIELSSVKPGTSQGFSVK